MDNSQKSEANRHVVRRLLLVVVAMFGFGYAMVPIYDVLCDITGLNGKTSNTRANIAGMEVDSDRLVTVEFIASINADLPWEFRPAVTKMQVHPGQSYTTSFFARNRADQVIVGRAVPSVTPGVAARHFKKIECFCFTEQLFQPGEGRDMPLQFVVDPALPEKIETVTLSYTFFDKNKMINSAASKYTNGVGIKDLAVN